jgi:hypothetical protein
MALIPRMLTATEVATLCRELTRHRCTPRQVRHLLVTGGLAADARRRPNGQTRLYTVVDVAFVRLAVTLQADGVSPWVARVVLTYLKNDLVRTWKAGSAAALTISGVHGLIQPAVRTAPTGVSAYVPLREIWRGLESEAHRVAVARPTLWMWREVSVDAVPRTTA